MALCTLVCNQVRNLVPEESIIIIVIVFIS